VVSFDSIAQVLPTPIAAWDHTPESPSIIENEIQLIDQSVEAETYQWSIDGIGVISNEASPYYSFPISEVGTAWNICQEVTNVYGCRDELCLPVVVQGELSIWVPSAFTPDGDGINEKFRPIVVGGDPDDFVFRVYDRWGNVVFETIDMNEGWSGQGLKKQDYFVPDGIYSWQLIVRRLNSSEKVEQKGSVTILR